MCIRDSHFSLLGLLVAVAAGKLFGYEGNVIVVADSGPGFCSASPAAFDSFRAGNTVDGTSLYPICLRVNHFQAHYLPTLSLIHISEPTRLLSISYAVFCL